MERAVTIEEVLPSRASVEPATADATDSPAPGLNGYRKTRLCRVPSASPLKNRFVESAARES